MSSPTSHLVVDGSNIATEGRNLPSLQQLDEAVRAVIREKDFDSLTVIVDATFAHRIDQSEREEFDAAVDAGEIIMPPAGVVGRGDAFILQVAEKANAAVFSNDSFQEFHGEHGWLFDEGRLLGGKPIEHIGWVFVDRVPVRGPASRRSVRESRGGRNSPKKTNKRQPSKSASGPPPVPDAPPPRSRRASDKADRPKQQADEKPKRGRGRGRSNKTDNRTPKTETAKSSNRQKQTNSPVVEELNTPPNFLSFISTYSIGDPVEAVVERFASHGCYLLAGETVCYLPSKSMGDPSPKRARDIVAHKQSVMVRVVSLDSDRRGINVELISVGSISNESASDRGTGSHVESVKADKATGAHLTRSKSQVATKKKPAARKAATKKKVAAKKPTKRAATATSSARAKKAATKKAVAKKKAPAKKAAAKKAVAKKKAPARKAAAKKAVAKKKAPARKAAAKKAVAKKKAPAKKAAAKKAVAKKTVAKKAVAKKAPAKKAAAKKAVAKKAPAKKAAAKKAVAKKKAPAKKRR